MQKKENIATYKKIPPKKRNGDAISFIFSFILFFQYFEYKLDSEAPLEITIDVPASYVMFFRPAFN